MSTYSWRIHGLPFTFFFLVFGEEMEGILLLLIIPNTKKISGFQYIIHTIYYSSLLFRLGSTNVYGVLIVILKLTENIKSKSVTQVLIVFSVLRCTTNDDQ